jgi:lysophospholipase L1-like esterase
MSKYRIYGVMTASVLLGEYEADSKEAAQKMCDDDMTVDYPSLCHQCADTIEIGDILVAKTGDVLKVDSYQDLNTFYYSILYWPPSACVSAAGDSTVGFNNIDGLPILNYVATPYRKTDLAQGGDTIADQKADWIASLNKQSNVWVVVQIGLNDIIQNPTILASTVIADLQDLINTISADLATGAKTYVSQMIPCLSYWIAQFGGVTGAIAQQTWVDVNDAMAGNGPTPITGVDGRITSHVALMGDGSGNLNPAYDTGDGLHPNEDGRIVNADAWMAVI